MANLLETHTHGVLFLQLEGRGFKSDNSYCKVTLGKLFVPNCLEESNRKPSHTSSVGGEKLTGHALGQKNQHQQHQL